MKQNQIATALNTIAKAVYVLSLIGALFIYIEMSKIIEGSFPFAFSVTMLFNSLLFGTLILGFSEVIRLLSIIADKKTSTEPFGVSDSEDLPEL